MIASFAGVFAICLVVVSIITPLLSSAIHNSVLGGFDQALGFVFGVIRGIVLVAIALVIYDRVVTTDTIAIVDDSRTAKIFARSQNNINEQIPEDAPGWIVGKYEQLVSSCTAPSE